MSQHRSSPDRTNLPHDHRDLGVRLWRAWNKPLAICMAGLYAVFILIFAFFVGTLLGDFASDWALRNSLPAVTTERRHAPEASAETVNSPADKAAPPVDAQEVALPVTDLPENRVNILLLGSDERVGDGEPPRTDTIILLALDLEKRTAGMISLTRDLWLPIPFYNVTTKINTAFALGEQRGYPGGGPQLTMDTVSSIIGQPVEYYVQADFSGFVHFIDEIGGVTVDVPHTIYDPEYPTPDFGYQTFHLDAGRQHLDGATALKYARTRNMDSDYGRATRQQQLLQSVADKVLSADMIPVLVRKGPQLMHTLSGSISTDMSWPTIREIAHLAHANSFTVQQQLVLDDRFGEETISENGAWILLPDRELIRLALREFFDAPVSATTEEGPRFGSLAAAQPRSSERVEIGSPAPRSNPNAADPVLAARDARLEILNGTSYPGIAARMRRELQAKGWRVDAIGDADRSDYRRTLLINYNMDEKLARELGRQLNLTASLYTLPGLLVPESTDLRIVIGEDYLTNASNNR